MTDSDGRRAAQMLELVRRLHAVEDQARAKVTESLQRKPEASADERHEMVPESRQQKAVPILAEIKAWLDEQIKLVLPRSPIAAAIQYTLNQWEALCRYCEAGYLDIDNNAAERAMKRVAIGRKNWLIAGNDAAAQSHARLYTLIASAERHGLDPQKYLTSVLAKIGQTPISAGAVSARGVEARGCGGRCVMARASILWLNSHNQRMLGKVISQALHTRHPIWRQILYKAVVHGY